MEKQLPTSDYTGPRYYDGIPGDSTFGRRVKTPAERYAAVAKLNRSLATRAIESTVITDAERHATEPVVLKLGESAMVGVSDAVEDVVVRTLFDGRPRLATNHDTPESVHTDSVPAPVTVVKWHEMNYDRSAEIAEVGKMQRELLAQANVAREFQAA